MSYASYPAYKDSGAPWVGAIPSTWDTRPFFAMAVPNEQKNTGGPETNLLSLSYGRIIRKDIKDNSGLLPESFDTYQIVDKGHIVFRLTDLQNDKVSLRSALVPERGIITSAYLAIRFHGLNAGFADYLMRSYDKSMVFYDMGGGVRQSGKFEDLKWMPVIVPPVEEQTAIADFLDKKTAEIDDLIAKKEELLRLLAEQRTALITHAVTNGLNPNAPMKPSGIDWLGEVPEGWDVFPLSALAEIRTGFAFSSDDFVDEGVPLIRISDVGADGVVTVKGAKRLPSEYAGAYSRYQVLAGDLLMAMTGATVGKAGLYSEAETALLNQRVCLLRAKPNAETSFVRHLMNADFYQRYVRLTAFGGAQPNISDREIVACRVPVPPLDQQEAISDYLDRRIGETDKVAAATKRAIRSIKEYRTALITNAVTGKIDIRNHSSKLSS